MQRIDGVLIGSASLPGFLQPTHSEGGVWPVWRRRCRRFPVRLSVDMCGGDLAAIGYQRVMDMAELEVPMREPSEPVAAILVAFDVFVGPNTERDDRDDRQQFDP